MGVYGGKAKKINILNEIEIPYSTEATFAGNYAADYHINDPSVTGRIRDIRETGVGCYYDDNYIIGQKEAYDTYVIGTTRYGNTRNEFVINGVATKYSRTEGIYGATLDNMPGYYNVTFKSDMLVLRTNYRTISGEQYPVLTGDAYGVSSISLTGYRHDDIYMQMSNINGSNYENTHVGYVSFNSSFGYNDRRLDTCICFNSMCGYGIRDDETVSRIMTKSECISYISSLLEQSQIYDSSLSDEKKQLILDYVESHMTYGALGVCPFYIFYELSDSSSFYNLYITIARQRDYGTEYRGAFVPSAVLVPNGLNEYNPNQYVHKIWFIPFANEAEYNAAMCACTSLYSG